MPISKVDLNGQYLAIPFNFQNQNSHQTATMAIKGHTPWPATSNLPVIQQKSLGDLWRYFFRMSTPPITPLAQQLHSLKSLPNTKQLESMRVNPPRSSKKTKKTQKTLADFFTSWSSAKKRSKTLGGPQFAAQKTSNTRSPFFWSCPLGWSSDVCDSGRFAPLLFAHWLNALLVQGTHSSLESLKFLFSLGLKINNRCSHRTQQKKQLPDQTNQTSNCQWPGWTS